MFGNRCCQDANVRMNVDPAKYSHIVLFSNHIVINNIRNNNPIVKEKYVVAINHLLEILTVSINDF